MIETSDLRLNIDDLNWLIQTRSTLNADFSLELVAELIKNRRESLGILFGNNADILSQPISELDLSVRAHNCLESARFNTIRDIIEQTSSQLLRLRSFGRTSLQEIQRKLAHLGLALRPEASAQEEANIQEFAGNID